MKINDDIELIKGDCLIEMQNIKDKSIDLILCDLPYQITANKWDVIIPFEPLWKQYERIIKDNGAIVLFGCQPFSSALIMSNIKMFRYELIYNKSNSTGFLNANKMPLRKHENILVFYKKLPTYNPQFVDKPAKNIRKISITNKINRQSPNYGKMVDGNFRKIPIDKAYPTSILSFNNGYKKNMHHPTAKPIPLLEYLIKTYSNENDIVLDNTMGCGSTGVACVNTNRKFIGIELNEEYFDIAVQQINNALSLQLS